MKIFKITRELLCEYCNLVLLAHLAADASQEPSPELLYIAEKYLEFFRKHFDLSNDELMSFIKRNEQTTTELEKEYEEYVKQNNLEEN